MVDNGANFIAEKCHLNTFLYAARRLEIIVRAKGEDGLTPLVTAIIHDCQEVLESIIGLILKNFENFIGEDNPLWRMLRVFRSSEFNNGNPVLHLARHLDIIRLMIEQGDDVNVTDKHRLAPLHYASHFGRLEMMKSLFANGANVNSKADDGSTPLHEVCGLYCSGVEPINWLVESGSSVNSEDHSGKTHYI